MKMPKNNNKKYINHWGREWVGPKEYKKRSRIVVLQSLIDIDDWCTIRHIQKHIKQRYMNELPKSKYGHTVIDFHDRLKRILDYWVGERIVEMKHPKSGKIKYIGRI